MRFKAKIKMALTDTAPLTHTGWRSRQLKRGDSFITNNPEEALYYKAQPGFSVNVLEGKLVAQHAKEPEDVEADEAEAESESDDEPSDGPVRDAYTRADLKRMKVPDLLALIETDEALKLERSDLPKKPSKAELISAILGAQSNKDDEPEEDEDEDGEVDDDEADD